MESPPGFAFDVPEARASAHRGATGGVTGGATGRATGEATGEAAGAGDGGADGACGEDTSALLSSDETALLRFEPPRMKTISAKIYAPHTMLRRGFYRDRNKALPALLGMDFDWLQGG